jgi:N-acetylglucosaminyl-diphospho-decaprenol L-rhamnosyltransferase
MGSNDGFGAACNAGLRAASTELVLFANPDIIPSPSALERLLNALMSTSTAAIAGAALCEPVEARHFSRVTGELWYFVPRLLKGRAQCYKPTVAVDQTKDHVVVDFVEGAFILCRVAALRSVEGFDERFFLYSEEEDLSRRLGMRGWQTLLVPSAAVMHGYSESSEGGGKAMMAPFRLHSLYWYYRKYYSRVYAELARCVLAICILIHRAYRALTHQQQIYGPRTAAAPFRSIDAIRRDYQRRLG